jgi:hypothetical protein
MLTLAQAVGMTRAELEHEWEAVQKLIDEMLNAQVVPTPELIRDEEIILQAMYILDEHDQQA